ncbi:ribbon-helix-helix protein, CopG family [Nocardioides sp. LHD-245]|uniref:type II toxin-antitoxin system VapB family antitoxin n=1 Tax=Nocardioides sp. LHD-245 TaxID=3051387 RepID=UPI0027DFBB4F|nr:ribbon-helix-helix protein, CopG family [Nocardioides sp. LHD-245]
MTDVLIRNVSDDDLRRIDEKARRLGLSRVDYLRRMVIQEAARGGEADEATVEVFARVADLAGDLADDEVMRDAWS